jgi:hypothetical protein
MDQLDDAVLDDIKFLSKNSREDHGQSNSKAFNRKSKKLPWNSEILRDRFTPQPFQIQVVELCLDDTIDSLIIFMSNKEWKNYLKMTLIKQYSFKIKSSEKKLMLLVTNMGSDVSKYVELLSRHTNLKIAGIDSSNTFTQADTCQLKREAHILVISINILFEWFKLGFVSTDELMVVIFDDVCGSFYNENYKNLLETYFNEASEKSKPTKIIGLGSLEINRSITHTHIRKNFDYLKSLFKCDLIETATDLLDTHNIFYGYEPKEYIHVCDDSSLINFNADADAEFQSSLVIKIKKAYLYLEDLNSLKNPPNGPINPMTSNGLFTRYV